MYLVSNNYLVGRSVEPSRKKDSGREGGRGGSGGWGKGRRTETERMGGKGGEVNGKEGCGEGGGGGGGVGCGRRGVGRVVVWEGQRRGIVESP